MIFLTGAVPLQHGFTALKLELQRVPAFAFRGQLQPGGVELLFEAFRLLPRGRICSLLCLCRLHGVRQCRQRKEGKQSEGAFQLLSPFV